MSRQKRDINLIYAISFMDLFAIGLTFPLFNNHLREIGASHLQIGLVSSLYAGLQIISGPVAGSWSDVRDRKSVLITSLFICSLTYAALGLVDSVSFITIIRVILGCIKHTQSICRAIITDLLPPNQRSEAFGKSAAYASIGFVAGPIIGGHVYEYRNGFMYVCILTGFLFVINVVLAYNLTLTKKTSKAVSNNQILNSLSQEFHKSVKDLIDIDWKQYWHTFLLRFLFGCTVSMYFSQQPLYLKERFELTPRQIGYTISFYSSIGTIASFLINYINKFYKNDEDCSKRMRHFFILLVSCCVAFNFAADFQVFLAILVPFAISTVLLRITSMEVMLKQANADQRGSFAGASNSIMSLSRFMAGVSSGLFNNVFGGQNAVSIITVPAIVGLGLTFKLKRDKQKTK